MMQKRLMIAKRLLKQDTGVLIVTIDEHEVHHLRVLLQELFSEYYIQMVTSVINPKGVTRGRFSRVEEYAVFCFAPQAFVADSNDNLLNPPNPERKPRWRGLLRSGTNARREDSKNQFYPVLIDSEQKRIIKALEALPYPEEPNIGAKIEGYDVAWPIRTDKSFGNWMVSTSSFNTLLDKGYVSLGAYDATRQTWGISYISKPQQKQIERGAIKIIGRDPDTNKVEIEYASDDTLVIKTVWHRTHHDAGAYGTDLISSVTGQLRSFSFPKSLYSTKDALSAVARNKKDALIIDFFAGSGTTLHAVNLMNAEDGGRRRCILVTNNEVSAEESQNLVRDAFHPGDPEWEAHGICRSVTWPRTVNSILGKRSDGTTITGEYHTNLVGSKEVNRSFYHIGFIEFPMGLSQPAKKQIVAMIGKDKLPQSLVTQDCRYIVSERYTASVLFDSMAVEEWLEALNEQDHISEFFIVVNDRLVFDGIKGMVIDLLGPMSVSEPLKRPMSEGFPANVEYFKLGFLDKDSVSLGQQFREILPLLWLKAGAVSERPELSGVDEPVMMVLPQNEFAVLLKENAYSDFIEAIQGFDSIKTVYFVTNSETGFLEMSNGVAVERTYQLYRDYLDNFVIGGRRASQ